MRPIYFSLDRIRSGFNHLLTNHFLKNPLFKPFKAYFFVKFSKNFVVCVVCRCVMWYNSVEVIAYEIMV